jgi:hypothetical protein
MAVTLALSQDGVNPQNPAYRRASHFSKWLIESQGNLLDLLITI